MMSGNSLQKDAAKAISHYRPVLHMAAHMSQANAGAGSVEAHLSQESTTPNQHHKPDMPSSIKPDTSKQALAAIRNTELMHESGVGLPHMSQVWASPT